MTLFVSTNVLHYILCHGFNWRCDIKFGTVVTLFLVFSFVGRLLMCAISVIFALKSTLPDLVSPTLK